MTNLSSSYFNAILAKSINLYPLKSNMTLCNQLRVVYGWCTRTRRSLYHEAGLGASYFEAGVGVSYFEAGLRMSYFEAGLGVSYFEASQMMRATMVMTTSRNITRMQRFLRLLVWKIKTQELNKICLSSIMPAPMNNLLSGIYGRYRMSLPKPQFISYFTLQVCEAI